MKMNQQNEFLDKIAATLLDKKRILIAAHIYPDADALGSQLGLGIILETMGKKVFYYSEAGCSHLHNFLPNCSKLTSFIPEKEECDAVIALDCGDRFRLGREMDRLLSFHPFLVIDHHAGHKHFGDFRWVDFKRSSTGEMIYELAQTLEVDIPYEAAFCLYTAIVSDTGSFKYSSTTANTFRVAGELIAKGVKPSEVAGKLFDNFSPARLKLLQEVLATLVLHENGRVGIISVTKDLFAKTGTSQEDTEDFISYPRALNLVQVAIFIKETKDDSISVSLRSKGNRDVAQIARKFDGGGHRNAAGFRLKNFTKEEICEKLLPEIIPILT